MKKLSLLTLLGLIIFSLVLTGCNPFRGTGGSATSTPAAQQATPNMAGDAASIPAQPLQQAQVATATVVIPGVPTLCSPTPSEAVSAPTVAAQPVVSTVPPFVFYKGGTLASGWSDASWGGAKSDYNSTEVQHDSKPVMKATFGDGWGAAAMADWNKSNLPDSSKYSHLHFWINGGASGGQAIGIMIYTAGGNGERLRAANYTKEKSVTANKWQEIYIPLEDFKTGGLPAERVVFQEVSGKAQSPFYLDGIELYSDNAPLPTPVTIQASITVNMARNRQPISPYIYGMSLATNDVVKDANVALNRLGGNPYSRYNWTLGNARNAGSDWEYRNNTRETDNPGYTLPSGLADIFFRANKGSGADTLLTVPTLGYVAKDSNNNSHSTGVPEEGGAPVSPGSEAIPGYDPAANQRATSVHSFPTKGAPFSDPPAMGGNVYQDEWINHLVHTFGKAVDGGVRFYAMDNEPDLWADNTHLDVHPVRPSYDSMLKNFTDYASAVKAVDPTSQVTGPVVSGWTGYWYSALDRGTDSFDSHPDRKAHGDMPLIPWFLDQVHKHDTQAGTRTLDVLDIHYYPQGQGLLNDKIDAGTSLLRLRSTRSLWDPTYEDESWISRTDQKQVNLIPRMKAWIEQYYPGTKLGITEWKWGAEKTMNGALAIADVLGIYGREGVYLANYYTNPPLGSAGLNAFKMFRNYDGQNATFGDTSVQANSSVADKIAVYASEDSRTGQAKIIVLNKSEREQAAANISLQGGNFSGPAKVYGMSTGTQGAIKSLPDANVSGSTINYTFAPYSVTILVVDKSR